MPKTELVELSNILSYLEQSKISKDNKTNAKKVVDCLLFLSSQDGQKQIVDFLLKQSPGWLDTVYQWLVPAQNPSGEVKIENPVSHYKRLFNYLFPKKPERNHDAYFDRHRDDMHGHRQKETIAIHFDRDNESKATMRELVQLKSEDMLFRFKDGFSAMNNDVQRNNFLSKLTEGACLEGRISSALEYAYGVNKHASLPSFNDLMLQFRDEVTIEYESKNEIYLEDAITYIFNKYQDTPCQPDEQWCPTGKVDEESVKNYFELILGFDKNPTIINNLR